MRNRNFFNRFRPRTNDHKEAGTEEHVSYINHSSSAVGWGTVSHPAPESWAAYQAAFEQNVDSFISRANPDAYNAACLDREVSSKEEIAQAEARFRRVSNQRSIHNIRIYQEAVLQELDLRISRLEEALEKCEEELKC